jgi:hypothetical protein
MKVDLTRTAFGTTGTYGVDASSPRSSAQVSAGTPASDTLSISGDAGLAERALAAVKASPAIRPEAVARGKQLIQSGAAGADLEALSDSLISRMLESWPME